jgi:hypothetical protein
LDEEPYHIDELRQTRSYAGSFEEIIESSFAQDQPPLDPLLNSLLQRLIGVGDWQQRLLSALFGFGAIAGFARLLTRAGLTSGAPYAIFFLGLSPVLLSVLVYARPYALPFFLIVAFLLTTDLWLRERDYRAAVALAPIALLLPLSRTLEPNIALGAVILVLIGFHITHRSDRFVGSIWLPISAAALGVGMVGVPVILRLQSRLAGYTGNTLLPSNEQLMRIVTDLPTSIGGAIPAWPFLLVLVLGVIASPTARRSFSWNWWSWVWLILPAGFTLGFLLTTEPSQPLYNRYLFTIIPLAGLFVAIVVSDVKNRSRLTGIANTVAIAIVLVTSAIATGTALTSHERGNWKALSIAIMNSTDSDTLVILEQFVPVGAYRTPYAGHPRYLPTGWLAPRALSVIRDPGLIAEGQNFIFAIAGPSVVIEGWAETEVDDFFSLYTPMLPQSGPEAAAHAMLAFSRELSQDRGAVLTLAAAALFNHIGRDIEACTLLTGLGLDESVNQRSRELIEFQESDLSDLECRAVNQ